MSNNPMRNIRMDKLTINMGAGESGPRFERCKALLEKISQKKVVTTITKKRTTFGVAKNKPIGVKVTLRGRPAQELLSQLLRSSDNKLKESNFDSSGNFSFGIAEYINIPGIKYDPDIGILGMDVCVSLARPGFRVARRMIRPRKIGKNHKITREEAMEWARKTLKVEIVKKVE